LVHVSHRHCSHIGVCLGVLEGTEMNKNTVSTLPDGSAFVIMSFPLPKQHWLYAPRQYMPGHDEPVELPSPVLTHADRDRVVAAIRYAVRSATMCGAEMDFDPDALVQNAVYALCGPFGVSGEPK